MPEPDLEFNSGQCLVHPRDGLSLYGPYDSKGLEKPRHLNYATFGTKSGLQKFRTFSQKLRRPILTEDSLSSHLWPHFPGFEETFHAVWPEKEEWFGEIGEDKLSNACSLVDTFERVYSVVNLYLKEMRIAKARDEAFDVYVCVVPDIVFTTCRVLSSGRKPSLKQRRIRSVMGDFFSSYDSDQYSFSLDFRRQLKARAMEFEAPIQIIRESTLRLNDASSFSERGLTPLSDRAWNLSTTLYYKSGGKPWRLSSARDGVCYVGIAFKTTEDKSLNACSAAQMFLDDGDGVVFMGDEGTWQTERRGDFHLSRIAARRLLGGVLSTYADQKGKPLREVFLHSRSSINEDEYLGYKEACPEGIKLTCIRVSPERMGLRAYRPGSRPVIRGTFWPVSERRGFLWASGFKPRLRTYDGSEVPQPLCVDIQRGDADLRTVAADILGLTKLNYNCCKLGESQPVTIHFSDAVGEILVANRKNGKALPNFKYYI
jgi:hypothetical protein